MLMTIAIVAATVVGAFLGECAVCWIGMRAVEYAVGRALNW